MSENTLGFNPEENPELAKRTGLLVDIVEGKRVERTDLFHTKILELKSATPKQENARQLLTFSRDPGSAAALSLVVDRLIDDPAINITLLADGRAEQIFRDRFKHFEVDAEMALGADKAIPTPDLILADASEEQGLDTYANATFNETPLVLVEDNPGSSAVYLQCCKERPGLKLPDKICVMDDNARQALIEKFPELEDRLEITGQPAFDRIANEDITGISKEVRQKLGISDEEKVVSFMSTDEVTSDQFEQVCQQIAKAKTPFKFIFRRHPRDLTEYKGYFEILKANGIEPIDSSGFTTDQISAASDLVFTSWSSAGLEAIYRGKPTIYVVDSSVIPMAAGLDLPLPAVKLESSVGITDISQIPSNIDQLLDENSELAQKIRTNMQRHYPNDGKNAERVANVVRGLLASVDPIEKSSSIG